MGENFLPEGLWSLIEQKFQGRAYFAAPSCMVWTGHHDLKGYGKTAGGMVHRKVWQAMRNRRPGRLVNTCGRKGCLNPDHWREVPRKQRSTANEQRSCGYCGKQFFCRPSSRQKYHKACKSKHYRLDLSGIRELVNRLHAMLNGRGRHGG